jgi:uncharacterized protein (TIGR02996 family)
MAKRGAVPVPEARNEAMELEIERDLAHDDAFLVYADWLQTHGNPRGELVALDAAGQVEQAEELRERLLPQLLGPLASFAEALDIRWRCGFIDAMRVETTREDEDEGHDVVQRLDAALKLPVDPRGGHAVSGARRRRHPTDAAPARLRDERGRGDAVVDGRG